MSEIEKYIEQLANQEKSLVFNRFDSDTALQLGLSLVEKAREEKKAITIDIMKAGQQLFHYAFAGTTPDNDCWTYKKRATVNRFYKSSLHVGQILKKRGMTLSELYNLSPSEYAAVGGAFPITVKGAGVVGSIAVSGLTQEEDHEMVVWSIREYLEKQSQ